VSEPVLRRLTRLTAWHEQMEMWRELPITQISPPSYNSRMRGSGLLRNRAWLIAST
jgi:hypothetical protein